jgi:hypothetical protein
MTSFEVDTDKKVTPRTFTARLAAILLAVGYWGHGAGVGMPRKRGAGSPAAKNASRKARSQNGIHSVSLLSSRFAHSEGVS